MLTPDLTVELKPAPWQLTGCGYILLYRFERAFLLAQGFIPPALQPHFQGGPSVVMLVDYQQSDGGPYQELLFIPGRFAHRGHSYYSISKIYVSTMISVLNGQRNWAIPKAQADFHFEPPSADRRQRVTVSQDGQGGAAFTFQQTRLPIPLTTALIPPGQRTLIQIAENKRYFTAPGGHGTLRRAPLVEASADPAFFPDLRQGRCLLSVQVTDFRLQFPIAYVEAADAAPR